MGVKVDRYESGMCDLYDPETGGRRQALADYVDAVQGSGGRYGRADW